MAWCAKIYDILNGWNGDESDLPTITNNNISKSIRTKRFNSDLYQHNLTDNDTTIIQHDSPILERSESLNNAHLSTSGQLYNNDYLNRRDYRGEHICADTLFSCHQRDGQYYSNPQQQSYNIATISHMSLNLPKSVGGIRDIDGQQQLSRSYSLDFPMELRRSQTSLPVLNHIPVRMRHSMNAQANRQSVQLERPSRASLNHSILHNSQVSLPNREDSFTGRISTRSTYSTLDYESSEVQSRNTDQVQQAIQYYITEMLTSSPGGVFPMIYRIPSDDVLHEQDRYRVEGGYGEPSQWIFKTKILSNDCRITSENIALLYMNYFYDQYHYDIFAIDEDFDPVVMSIKPQNDELTVIVRTKEGSKSMTLVENENTVTNYITLAQHLYPDLHIDHFESCTSLKAQQYVKEYDEKLETQKFKFGIIYQRRGQTTEEEFFNNERHSRTFDEFLDIIATRVSLKNFKGYRGGLDTSEDTDSPISYYECYDDKEIMFHVSTLLPFTPNDVSQIQRKRHIGNDIVAIVFQEENTPFHPSMIKSNFLHIFLVIQPVQILSRTCYKMMLIARDNIQEFSPILHPNVVYVRTAEHLKPFILSKLINAEYAAYRCRTFALLQQRTRCSYLKTLCENLSEKSYEVLCDEQKRVGHHRLSLLSNSARKRYLFSMKKIFSRSSSISDSPRQSLKSSEKKTKASKKLIRLGKSMDSVDAHPRLSLANSSSEQESTRENSSMHQHANGPSDDSLNDSADMSNSTIQHNSSLPTQVYYGDESDEGLDSMSSVETTRVPYDSDDQDAYRQQLREKSYPSHIWQRISSSQRHICTPQTAGIHISEEATV
ncbi:unnamed protein product [Adineta ricciae]|uniref:Rap-GAP domain-containing protein n=2 Tax=Adineta ricciae TaxID=249248 RepID=A0A814ZFL6_ADIRI|nr:unnamed protein product [Adineta ricciae]